VSRESVQAADRRRRVIEVVIIASGLYVFVGGSISLFGWVLDMPRLADWNRDGITIKANAAICLIIAATGLLLWAFYPQSKWAIRSTGILTTLIAGLTLFAHISGLDTGIDTLLFSELPGAAATSSPGRMGVPASTSLTMIGAALIFLTYEDLKRWTGVLGIAALGISLLSLVGYGFGADQLYAIPRLSGIAWQTASMIAAIGVSLVMAVPDHGIAEIASRDDGGGLIFRRLFIPVLAISMAVGWLQVLGLNSGLYDTAFGSAIRTLIEIALLLGFVLWTAAIVSRREARIREAAAALSERDEYLRDVLASLSDAFMSFDADLRLTRVNAAVKKLLSENNLDPSEMIGKGVFEVFPEARGSELAKGLIRCHKHRAVVEMEELFEPFNRWFHSRFFPTDDGGVTVYALDITERKNAEMLVRRRAHELALLYEFTDNLNRTNSLSEVYEAALDTITRALDCQRASILLFDDQGVMSFVAARGLSPEYMEAVNGHTPWKQGEKGARPLGIENINEADIEPELRNVIVGEGILALGFIPLIYSDTLIGKFMVYYDAPHVFTEEEFEIALTVGYQIAFGVERKRTEEALRENEERLRLATQTGKVGVWDWNILTNHVSWTPTVYTMHGVEPGDFDGTVDSFSALVHPEDREFVVECIEKSLKEDTPYEVEFRVQMPDGSINWLFTNAVVLRDSEHRPVRMIGATVDITESKNAERELARVAAIVNSSRDAIVGKDLNGIVTSWNKGAERLFGYTSDEMVGKSITRLIPEDRIDEEARILTRLRRGEYIDHYETIRQRKDGTKLEISLTVSPVFDSRGRIIGASKIARDITEQRRTESAIRSREIMKRLVEAQEAERHRIARDLHDHLGQQLTALRLKLESIRAKCNGDASLAKEMDETQEYASRIDMDINYLAWELRPTELDQLGLGNALRSFVREWSKTYDIAAEFHTSRNLGDRLPPDLETNLYRIVQEALNNILKHANALNVSVLLEKQGERVVLIIEDDGIGFVPDVDRPKASGEGLGLIGMRERTALLGGVLEIESRPGEGTTVYARVPLYPPGNNGDMPSGTGEILP
jgi:PAS domain S-box-containing protein